MLVDSYKILKNIKSFVINFGPQHPAAHWGFTVSFRVGCGEVVLRCVPHGRFFT
jgi:NADH:ubiquinone oxidoreductase subunit D